MRAITLRVRTYGFYGNDVERNRFFRVPPELQANHLFLTTLDKEIPT